MANSWQVWHDVSRLDLLLKRWPSALSPTDSQAKRISLVARIAYTPKTLSSSHRFPKTIYRADTFGPIDGYLLSRLMFKVQMAGSAGPWLWV
jgi:hypothetical protein